MSANFQRIPNWSAPDGGNGYLSQNSSISTIGGIESLNGDFKRYTAEVRREDRVRVTTSRSARILTPPATIHIMAGDFLVPAPEKQNVRLIESRTVHEAERLIEPCEYCNPDGAEIPFDAI